MRMMSVHGKRGRRAALTALCLFMALSCARDPLREKMESLPVEPPASIFDSEADTYLRGKLTRVGGQMIRSASRADRLEVVAYELPLTKDKPVRPQDSAKPTGLFVFSFAGSIDTAGLQHGNKFLVVGRAEGTRTVDDQSVPRLVPFIVARCIHVWKTGDTRIDDFTNSSDGYISLVQQTYCTDVK
jgi:starvation-inducible outer membrane lipoprotein